MNYEDNHSDGAENSEISPVGEVQELCQMGRLPPEADEELEAFMDKVISNTKKVPYADLKELGY